MKNKKNTIAIFIAIGVTTGIVYSILYALGYFDPTAKDLLEQSKCEFCPNGNYKQFFDSNYDKKWSAEKYISKNEKEMIRVKTQNIEDSSLFFFQLSDDHYVFYGMQRGDLLYKSKSKEVQAFFNKRCKNINATAVDRKLPDDYPFPVRLDSIMKNANMIFTDDVKLTDSLGTAWKYVKKSDQVSPYYNKKPFNGYINDGPKIGDYDLSQNYKNIDARLIGYSNGKKSGLTYIIRGTFFFETKYVRKYKRRASYDGGVVWKNSILLYVDGKLMKELQYEILDYDFWKGRKCKYGKNYIWDLNFSPTSRQHVINSFHYKNGKKHGSTVINYEYGWFFKGESNLESLYGLGFEPLTPWASMDSKKDMKRVENFNEDHPHEKGSYSHGKRTGEWIEYYFNGEIKKRITYNNKGEEMKHIEYDKEGLIKSNTGYKL